MKDTRGPGHIVTDGVLSLTHTPDNRPGAVSRQCFRSRIHLRLRDPSDLGHLRRGPLLHDLFLDLIHTPDAVIDISLVFPTVLKDVIEQAKEERHIRARTEPDVLISFCRSARETRVNHNDLTAVLLFGR